MPKPDLAAIERYCEAATPGPLREGIDGNLRAYGPDGTEHAGCIAQFYGVRKRENLHAFTQSETDLPALVKLAREQEDEIAKIRDERDDALSLLASATDLMNTWAREHDVNEARTEADIKGLVNRLWDRSMIYHQQVAQLRESAQATASEIADLKRKLGEAEKDRELVNYLEEGKRDVEYCVRSQGGGRWEVQSDGPHWASGDTLRAAYAAARQLRRGKQ